MAGDSTLTPESQRAARALLGWGVRELAVAAGIAWTTVSQFENGRPMRASTAAKVIGAFESHGVDLVGGEDRTGAVLVFDRRKDA